MFKIKAYGRPDRVLMLAVERDLALRPRRAAHSRGIREGAKLGQQAFLTGLYLQAEILGVDAALGKAAGDEPETRLSGAHKHVAQLLVIAKSPDRAKAGRNIIAEQFANQVFLAFEAGRQHDEIRRERFAAAQP